MSQPPGPHQNGRFQGLLSQPYLILALTTLFWGGNVVAGKAAVGNVDPYTLITLRWAGAFLAILPFAIGPLRRDWPALRQNWWLYLFYGAVGFTTFNVLVYVAAYFTSGVNNALDQVAINIFVMLGNFVLFRTRVRALQIVGVLITIVGVAVTATHGDLDAHPLARRQFRRRARDPRLRRLRRLLDRAPLAPRDALDELPRRELSRRHRRSHRLPGHARWRPRHLRRRRSPRSPRSAG